MAEKTKSPVRSPVRSPRKEWDASAVGRDDYVASLTRRLDILEKRLVGKRRTTQPLHTTLGVSTNAIHKHFTLSLLSLSQNCEKKLEDSLHSSQQSSIHTLWNASSRLERLLDPAFVKNAQAASQSAKEDLLVGYTEQLKLMSGKAEELQQLKDYINSTEFQGLDSHESQLAVVANKHGQREREVEELSQQTQELVKAYSQLMLQLSAQCVEWGEQVAKLEKELA